MPDDKFKKPSTMPFDKGDEEAAVQGWDDKLKIFYAAHSRAITSTALLLVVAGSAVGIVRYRESVREKKAVDDAMSASTIEAAQNLLTKWGDTKARPLILYRLGSLYYAKGTIEDLEKAEGYWEEVINKFRDHPIADVAGLAFEKVRRDIDFLKKEEDRLRYEYTLLAHPLHDELFGDEELRTLPEDLTEPRVRLSIGDDETHVELFADEAPAPVEEFLKAVREKKLDGIEVRSGGDDRIEFDIGAPAPAAWEMPCNGRKLGIGTLAVVAGEDGKPVAGRYVIFKKDVDLPRDKAAAIGTIREGLVTTLPFRPGTKIASARIEKERERITRNETAEPELPPWHPSFNRRH